MMRAADEIVGDVVDILVALTDFREFKDVMVAHRKGRDNGLALAAATAVVVTGIEPHGGGGGGGHAARDEADAPVAAGAGAAAAAAAVDFRARQQQQPSRGFVGGNASAADALSMGGRAREGRGFGESKG